MRIASLLFCAALLLTGCTHTVTWQKLQQESAKGQGNTLQDMTFYCGSKNGYDYFHIARTIQSSFFDEDYRVVSSQSSVKTRFKYTTNQQQWILYMPGLGATEQEFRDAFKLSQPSSVDISGVTSEEELDEYLGKLVTFTGKWQNTKEAGLSNGHVFVTPDLAFWGGSHSYSIGPSETVTGYLAKVVVAPDASEKAPVSVQRTFSGNHYYIEKNPPTSASTQPTSAGR
jgi:hypothetical protein